jgi:hypothetical protein
MKVLRELKNSELTRFAHAVEHQKFPSYRTRPLTTEEIASLERHANLCENWALIRVDPEFDPSRIRRCFLSGQVVLPRFFGTVLSPDGIALPAGLYDCTVHQCILENAHIAQVGTLSRMIVSAGCLIRNVGSLAVQGRTSFGAGRAITVGAESGNKALRIWPELNLDAAAAMLQQRHQPSTWGLWEQALTEFAEQVSSAWGFVGKDAILTNTPAIRNCWIGTAARIDGAAKVYDSTLLSTVEQPCILRDGALVEHSQLQWGVRVRSGAQVSNSLLCEESSAHRRVIVQESIIGSNTHLHEGEITSSLVGPFVGFHHQALLISVIWPEGMGNVAHGASVGCNHTGRAPDQEALPGKGQFFGMGSIIKFPAHYQDSPWSLFAPGLVAPPQRVAFPFSLLSPGRNPKAFRNEIVPGWMLRYAALGLMRNEHKFTVRNRSRRQNWQAELFGAETAHLVLKALQELQRIQILKDVYTDAEIPGLGKNYLTELNRQRAMLWYTEYLERFALLSLMQQLEKDPLVLRSETPLRRLLHTDLMREIGRLLRLPDSIALIPKHYRNCERRWAELALADHDRDSERAAEVLGNPYGTLDRNTMRAWLDEEVENVQIRCRELIKRSKETKS